MNAASNILVRLWDESSEQAQDQLSQVLRLGKKFSSTLGFLTDSAFQDRAKRKGMLVGTLYGNVVGYCLFGVNRSGRLKLLHVCVDDTARGTELGKRFVDTAVSLNPSVTGVLADCRRDYSLDSFWQSLGMHVASERPGRARNGSILNRWWKPLGEPDLLEASALNSSVPLVVLDSNIVADLYGRQPRDDREASQGLLADWLDASVVLAISPRVMTELDAITDQAERQAQRDGSSGLIRLRTSRPYDRELEESLVARIGEAALARDDSLRDDIEHLADAIRASASYFVTNDGHLLDAVGPWLENDYDIVALRPHQLVGLLQAGLDRPVYESRLLESVELSWVSASRFTEEDLTLAFLTYPDERPSHFVKRLRAGLSQQPATTTNVLVDENQKLFALVSSTPGALTLDVSLFRAARGIRASTLALQLTRHVRRLAHSASLEAVSVRDPFLAEATKSALGLDGFVHTDQTWLCETIPGNMPLARFAESRPRRPIATLEDVALAERHFWPLILTDAGLPTYVIPIYPRHAERLFGFSNAALFHSRRLNLGLSREHVYFNGGNALPNETARILWYVTGDKTDNVRQIAAYSRMVESVVLPPEEAHREFGHVGVLRLKDIKAGARKDGAVHVVRFEDTELLDAPLGRQHLRPLFAKHSVKTPIQSTRKVPSALFDDILQAQANK